MLIGQSSSANGMTRAVATPPSNVVRLAAALALLSGLAWFAMVAITIVRPSVGGVTGLALMLQHPLLLALNGVVAIAYLVAAALLNDDRWQGGALLTLLSLYRLIAVAMARPSRPQIADLFFVLSLGVALTALWILRRAPARQTGVH